MRTVEFNATQKPGALNRCLFIFVLLFIHIFIFGAELPYVPYDHCNHVGSWHGPHDIVLDTENQKEGYGCLSSTGDDLVSFIRDFGTINTYLNEENGYLKFWLYISDVSLFNGVGQIEITSSGSFDVDEYSWNMNNIHLKDGWNYLELSFASANKNGNPDLHAINYFRVYGFFNDVVTLKIDFIIFDNDIGIPLPGKQVDACNNITDWTGADDIYQDVVNKMESHASIASLGKGTTRFAKVFNTINPNISIEDGYLSFWLYVSDISAFDAVGQVEVTSSGGSDVDEYSWPVECMNLHNGWNHVFLKLSNANVIGNPEPDKVNYFRFYNFMNDSVLLRLDDIRYTENSPPGTHIVDPNTLHNKVLFGYQGWFGAPGDGSQRDEWVHWFRNNSADAANATFDNWPDLSEYDENELFETGMEYSNGDPVKLYSAYTYKTVDRHFKWMNEHQLDGVFLQRFIALTRWEGGLDFVDKVTENVKKSSSKYERVWAIEFCIQQNEDYWVETIKNDWMHLVDDLNVTLNPYYLRHKGRPLIGIYGIGFDMYSYATPEEAQELIDWFHSEAPEKYRATVMCGVPGSWRTDADYIDFYSTVDVIKPWSVGRYNDFTTADEFLNQYILPDKAFCDEHQMDYIPVIWPGFSWYNLMRDGEYQKNQFPRNGGKFYWRQSYNVNKADVNMIFVAMFDEVDEGTAMYKLEPDQENTPTIGYWVTLDADGYNLPSDWYLRLAAETGRTLRGEIVNDHYLPLIPNVKSLDSLHVVPGIHPEVVLPAEILVCQNETMNVQAVINNALWQNWSVGGSGTASDILGDHSKKVWVQAGNNCGNSSDTMNLVVNPNPVIALGASDTVRSGESISLSVPDDFVRYLWNDEPGTNVFVADNSNLERGENEIVLKVIDHNNCQGTESQSVYLLDPTNKEIVLIADEQYTVYPNPFKNELCLYFRETVHEPIEIALFDIHGVELIRKQTTSGRLVTLETNHLPQGNYILRVKLKDSVNVVSLVKE